MKRANRRKSLLTFYRHLLEQQTETAADMAALTKRKRKEKKRHDTFNFVFLVLSNLAFISIELLAMSKTASNTGSISQKSPGLILVHGALLSLKLG